MSVKLPVWDGTVTPLSRQMGKVYLALSGVALLVSAITYFLGWPFISLTAGMTTVVLAWLGCSLAFGTERLVLGKAGIQMVRKQDKVISQIPLSNIADVRLADHQPQFVGINLLNRTDPDTFASVKFEDSRKDNGFDYVIVFKYEMTPREIHELLTQNLAEYRRVQQGPS